MKTRGLAGLGICLWLVGIGDAWCGNGTGPFTNSLTLEKAAALASLPLRCIHQEFPNKLDHVMNTTNDVRAPRVLHPAFYGCYDWHSCVHGHWMLVRLLREYPNLPQAAEIRRALDENLSREKIQVELRYLDAPDRKTFERTYGWAWLLKLAQELHTWSDADGRRWAANLDPLARDFAQKYQEFLPRQQYPIRTGVHPNTAFGIAFALDYARALQLADFERLLVERARFYFEKDKDYPANWEPGGEDFFSPALIEADLMRRVLPPQEFQKWFASFLPKLSSETYATLLKPALVTDRADPKLVHLDGLNLSRAWCLRGIAEAVQQPLKGTLLAAAEEHLAASLPQIASGNYSGEHWLATFAVYALLQP